MAIYKDAVVPTDELVVSTMFASTILKQIVCLSGHQDDGRNTCIMLDRVNAELLIQELKEFIEQA